MICRHCKSTVNHEFQYCPYCGQYTEKAKRNRLVPWKKVFFTTLLLGLLVVSWRSIPNDNFAAIKQIPLPKTTTTPPPTPPTNPPTTPPTTPPGTSEGVSKNVDWILPIDLQLRYLRNKDIKSAYEETTSAEFKKATSLESYTQFIQRYPILFTHVDIAIKNQSVGANEAAIVVNLNPEKEDIAVNYLLRKEAGKWKVWSMNVAMPYSGTVADLLNKPEAMQTVIEGQLQALKSNDILKAYYGFTSQEFQKNTDIDSFRKFINTYPGVVEFDAVSYKQPIISKTTGHLEASIHSKYGTIDLEYTLGIENDQWKIWSVKLIQATPLLIPTPVEGGTGEMGPQTPLPVSTEGPMHGVTLERPSTGLNTSFSGATGELSGATGTSKIKASMQFVKAEVGTSLNPRGEIENPGIVLKSPRGQIYVNVYVRNGIANSKVNVTLEHLESHSILPEVSTTLQQNGDSILSFAFSPPSKGWPVGNYLVEAVSSTGAIRRQFSFIIRQ